MKKPNFMNLTNHTIVFKGSVDLRTDIEKAMYLKK